MSLKHDVRPFTVDIPDAQLDDLMLRLKRTRFPSDFGNDDRGYGHNTAYRELIDYWINDYDWRDVERRRGGKSPITWTKQYFNLRQYRVHDSGGHFAPPEVPEVYVDDVRSFFRGLR